MKAGLTPKQKQCFDFICEYFAKNLYPPSFDEIKDAIGQKSKSGVHRLVHGLHERGLIKFIDNRARSILPVGMEHLQAPTEHLQVSIDPELLPPLRTAAGDLGIRAQELVNDCLREALS